MKDKIIDKIFNTAKNGCIAAKNLDLLLKQLKEECKKETKQ